MNRIFKFSLFLFLAIQFSWSVEVDGNKVNSALINHPQNRENEIILTSIPMDFYKSVEEFSVTWIALSELDLSASLYISNSPGGGELENYTQTIAEGIGEILTTPEGIGYDVGLYYAVIGNPATGSTSIEFQLIVESQQSVQMVAPTGEINTTTPIFSWDPTPGVPYYHVILSDNPFVLAEDESGNMTVSGAQAIWQIITSETSVQYGDLDPSGSFENNAPPLVSGLTYNWLVMNNYGNSLLYSSQVASTPVEFEYVTEVVLESPQQIYPEFSDVENPIEIEGEDVITFQWSEVEGAMTYQIFLSELRLEAGSEIQYPIWNQVTTNNLIDFNASSILINAKYAWKIIASNADGVSSISDLSYFNYNIPFGRVTINARVECGETDCGVGYASATIDPIDGSGDVVPITVNSDGDAWKNLPLGSYLLTVEKPGFEIATETFELVYDSELVNDPTNVNGYSDEETVTVQMEWSPGSIYGNVVNSEGTPIESASVIAINSEGEERTANVSGGGYSLSVTPDVWTIYAQKVGYESVNFFQYSISGGQNFEAETLILQENNKNITGVVANTGGIPLSGVLVTAGYGNETRHEITSSNGNFTFEGVSVGDWSVFAEKLGYYSPPAITVEITELSGENTQTGTISLSPQANIVNGNVNNTVVGIGEVTITATPSSGLPITASTDDYGNYSINLPEGNYQFTAFKSNYSSQNSHSLILTVAETVDGIDFVLVPNESFITGKITSDGVGLSGVIVTTGESEDISDAFGNYSLSVNPGTFEISVQKTGYSSSGVELVSIGAGQTITDIDFSMNANASTITGTVYANGSTVFGAEVNGLKIINDDLSVEISGVSTNSYGEYQLDLLPGTYTIWSDKTNFVTDENDILTLIVQPGQSYSNQNIILTAYEAQISGTVVKNNGEALRNAEVIIQEVGQTENNISTVTNIQGGYSVIVTPEKAYEITISKDGYSTATLSTDGELEIGEIIQFSSMVEALPASIEGLVRDNEGNLLADVTISISSSENSYEAQTGIYGYFSVNVSDGEYVLNAEKPGYVSSSTSLTILPGQEIEFDFELEQNFSSYFGTILNSNDNSPIENVTVVATRSSGGGGTTHTNENGEFTLSGLLPGSYTIEFSLDGYQNIIMENEYLPGGVDLDKSTNLTPYTATLSVTVNYNSSGFGGVTIAVENQNTGEILSATTDNFGISNFEGLSSNLVSYSVTASKVNYFSSPITVDMIPGEDEYSESFELVLINSSITGSVVNSDDTSIGLGDVSVSAVSADGFSGQTTTDASGNFEIQNLNPGRDYEISVSKDGYTSLEVSTVSLNGETVPADEIAMTPNNRVISGLVKNQIGNPLENVNVNLVAVGFNLSSTTNTNGEFEFSSLAPMLDYYISTQALEEGWQNTETMVTLNIEASANSEDLIIQIDGSEISGIIEDNDNSDMLMGVQLTASNLTTSQIYSTTSQPDGAFLLDKLSAGEYQITATLENYESIVFSVELGDLATESHNFAMTFNQPLTVSGTVVDTDDRLISNAPLTLVNNAQVISSISDTLGNFVFEDVYPNRDISISSGLSSDDYDNSSIDMELGNSNVSNIEIEVDIHSAIIQLTVVDQNGNTIDGAQVELYLNSDLLFTENTSTDGLIIFTHLFEGLYSIIITKSGYNDLLHPDDDALPLVLGELEDGGEIIQTFSMQPKEGTIGGLVSTSSEMGEVLLSNVTVELLDNVGANINSLITGTDGSFEFEDLAHNESYTLSLNKNGFENYQTTFTFNEETPQSFVISMAISPNTIVGLVRDENGVLANEIDVHARNLEGIITSTQTDENGEFVINGVSGYFDMWSANEDNSFVSPYTPVSLSAGGSAYVELDLGPASKILGAVFYNGSGVSGVSISAENINTGALVSVYTGNDGSFEIPGLQTGSYNLIAYKEGYSVIGDLPTVSVDMLGENYVVDDINMTFVNNSLAGTVVNLETGVGVPIAEVILYDSEGETLDIVSTDAGGGFIFSGLIDGNYSIYASHPGYLELENNVDVSLIGGISEPIIVELEAKSFTIFGVVYDANSNLLENASVAIFSADTLITESETGVDGNYIFEDLQEGNFEILATKEDYDTSSANITLTNFNNVSERNFFLTPDLGSVFGEVLINNLSFDDGYLAYINSGVVKLKNLETEMSLEEEIGSSFYSFQFLELEATEYELSIDAEIEVMFNSSIHETVQFNDMINIELGIAENFGHNFEFTYNANSVNLSGLIQMREITNGDTIFHNVESGSVAVGENMTEIQLGTYQFYNLDTNIYDIQINAEFDDEVFSTTIENVDLTNAGTVVQNHTFDYILPTLTLRFTEDGTIPIPSATVQIISDREELTLITDDNGECVTAPEMHTNTEYIINVFKDSGTLGQFIPASPFSIWFEDLKNDTINKMLPLQFNLDQLSAVSATESITLDLNIALEYSSAINVNFANVSGVQFEMPVSNEGAVIFPAQGQSGEIQFYFTSQDLENEMNYSNSSNPYSITITSAGLISESSSTMNPTNPILAYGQEVELNLQIMDDVGNLLNDQIASVNWTMTNPNLGGIDEDSEDPTIAHFIAGTGNGEDIVGEVRATITQNLDGSNITIQLSNPITVKNLMLSNLLLSSHNPIDNDESAFLTVTASDSSGISMTVDYNINPIEEWQGTAEITDGGILVMPNPNFIGLIELEITASNANGNLITGFGSLEVYEQITPEDPATTLNGGHGFTLNIPSGMLKEETGSAEISLAVDEEVPSLMASSASANLASAVVNIKSNKPESGFNYLPGLTFTSDISNLNDPVIAYWDNNKLNWIELDESGNPVLSRSSSSELSVNEIPGWNEYGLLASSDPLGVYDIDIRPNPFTPNNDYGTRIAFRLSSDVGKAIDYSATIYNLNGTKVKALVRNLNVPKENCNMDIPLEELNECSIEECCVKWDGTTDDGNIARNGRYIVRIQAKDSDGKKEIVKPVVLFK